MTVFEQLSSECVDWDLKLKHASWKLSVRFRVMGWTWRWKSLTNIVRQTYACMSVCLSWICLRPAWHKLTVLFHEILNKSWNVPRVYKQHTHTHECAPQALLTPDTLVAWNCVWEEIRGRVCLCIPLLRRRVNKSRLCSCWQISDGKGNSISHLTQWYLCN